MKWLKKFFKLFESKPKKQVLTEELAKQKINQKLQEFKK
jgi:hypothetical protein